MLPSAKSAPGAKPAPKLAPEKVAQPAAAATAPEIPPGPFVPKKLDEMSADEWKAYKESVVDNHAKHHGRPTADLTDVPFLYHEAPAEVLGNIRKDGLCPRQPDWKKFKKTERVARWDASKDGYLSLSRTIEGASSMGGVKVMLRFAVGGDIADWDFKPVGATEVRTQAAIPASLLESSKDHRVWTPLVSVPATVVPAAAGAPEKKEGSPE